MVYSCSSGVSVPGATTKTLAARRRGEDPMELAGIRALEQLPFLRGVWFVISVLPQEVKLMACSRLPWTRVWGCFYPAPFIVVEVMNGLKSFAVAAAGGEKDPDAAGGDHDDPRERWMALIERVCGAVAMLQQLRLLASINMSLKPPSRIFHTCGCSTHRG